jgi:hypothetical protein
MKVKLADMYIDPEINIREKLDENTVARYMEIFDELPPVVVFTRQGDKNYLSDGFHRAEAAARLGLVEIDADIRQGGRGEAIEYAITANVAHGKALTENEYKKAVLALKNARPDWGYIRLAKAVQRSQAFVRHLLNAEQVRQCVNAKRKAESCLPNNLLPDQSSTSLSRRHGDVSDAHLAEIYAAPPEVWPNLVDSAQKKGWKREEVRQIVREIKDEGTTPERIFSSSSGDSRISFKVIYILWPPQMIWT